MFADAVFKYAVTFCLVDRTNGRACYSVVSVRHRLSDCRMSVD